MAYKDYGRRCQPCIDSARLLTPIFGLLAIGSFRVSDIKVWVKTVAKLVILSDLTALSPTSIAFSQEIVIVF